MSVEPSRSREPYPSARNVNLGRAALLSLAYLTEGFVVATSMYLALSQIGHVDDNTALVAGILTGLGTSYVTAKLVARRPSR